MDGWRREGMKKGGGKKGNKKRKEIQQQWKQEGRKGEKADRYLGRQKNRLKSTW